MKKKFIIAALAILMGCSAHTFAIATVKSQVYTLPLKFSVVNPCNGDTVKIWGKIKESITTNNITQITIIHDVKDLKAIGASGVRYKVDIAPPSTDATFKSRGTVISVPGPTFNLSSENTQLVPNFSFTEDLNLQMDPIGIVSVGFANFKMQCPF